MSATATGPLFCALMMPVAMFSSSGSLWGRGFDGWTTMAGRQVSQQQTYGCAGTGSRPSEQPPAKGPPSSALTILLPCMHLCCSVLCCAAVKGCSQGPDSHPRLTLGPMW